MALNWKDWGITMKGWQRRQRAVALAAFGIYLAGLLCHWLRNEDTASAGKPSVAGIAGRYLPFAYEPSGTRSFTQRSMNPKPPSAAHGVHPPMPRHSRAALDDGVRMRAQEDYARLPVAFEPNQGQTDKRVKFLSHGRGYSLFLTSTEAVLTLSQPATQEAEERSGLAYKTIKTRKAKSRRVAIRMQLVGANPQPSVWSGGTAWESQLLARQQPGAVADQHPNLRQGPLPSGVSWGGPGLLRLPAATGIRLRGRARS